MDKLPKEFNQYVMPVYLEGKPRTWRAQVLIAKELAERSTEAELLRYGGIVMGSTHFAERDTFVYAYKDMGSVRIIRTAESEDAITEEHRNELEQNGWTKYEPKRAERGGNGQYSSQDPGSGDQRVSGIGSEANKKAHESDRRTASTAEEVGRNNRQSNKTD